ncbi:MAG: (Fe-S)-binding protein [Candidatus Baldrarchaeota archaeon]
MAKIKFSNVKRFEEFLYLCGKCGDCSLAVKITTSKSPLSHPCAVKNVLGYEAYDARGRIIIIKNLLNGKLEVNDEILEWAYTCTTCGACRETCLAVEGGIDTPSIMEALRRDLVSQGFRIEKHLSILENIKKLDNPYGEPKEERLSFLGNELSNIPEKAEIAYFIGCTSSYRTKEIALAAVKLLKQLGVEFTVLRDETCCGSILLRYGYVDEARSQAERLVKRFNEMGVKTVIFTCPGCYRTFKKDYPEILGRELGFETLHLVEFLDNYLKDKNVAFEARESEVVTYHDPCHLGRHLNVYEAPRNIIRLVNGLTLVEMETIKNFAHCCGAGGGVKSTFPDLALKVAKDRISEALETGAKILLSACPFCKLNLKQAANNGIRILDVAELLAETYVGEVVEVAPKVVEVVEVTPGMKLMDYLNEHVEIFKGLRVGCKFNYEIVDWKTQEPQLKFYVTVLESGEKPKIKISKGVADNPDVTIIISEPAAEKLVECKERSEYAELFGNFFNEPTDEEYIDVILHRSTKELMKMGYGEFAKEAGLI